MAKVYIHNDLPIGN